MVFKFKDYFFGGEKLGTEPSPDIYRYTYLNVRLDIYRKDRKNFSKSAVT